MPRSEDNRLPWEREGGPRVGVDVPITSEPRPEVAPGVPAEPEPQGSPPPHPEEREVLVDDPGLSAGANERLTAEVREVIGSERVTVPSDRPRPSHGERPPQTTVGSFLTSHRQLLVRTFAAAFVIEAIITLVTGSWWFLPLAAGIHALGTMIVAAVAISATAISERPDPTTVARLEEEGVRNPERHFSQIVEEFTEAQQHGGTADIITPGANERTVEADAEPAKAAAEQSTAMTPSAGPSHPVGLGGADTSQPHAGHRRVVAIVCFTALAVAVFCVLIVLWLHH